MNAVTIDRLCKNFGTVAAVDNLALSIGAGEFVSLLGPSGCGKTTTLRMLAGLDHPTSGSIRIGDREITGLAPAERDIAMVFQSYALYPHMTVYRNIEYPLRKRRVPKAERPTRVSEAARLLQLEDLLDRKPRQLSGGQQQRVALGRALVRDPAVFLLDEPLSNLDAKLRAHMRAELIELRARIGKTMVYVTHDQLEAMTMSDRIAVLSEGRLQQFASPDEIYHRPANRFVAGFIGTPAMNFIDGELAQDESRLVFRSPDLEIALPFGHLREGLADPAARAVTLGCRPEHVTISQGGGASVRLVEPTGHETIVYCNLGDTVLIARMGSETQLRAGQPIELRLSPERLHVFDAASGERLNADPGSQD